MNADCLLGPPKENSMLEEKNTTTVIERLVAVLLNAGVEESDIRKQMGSICGVSRQGVDAWFVGKTKSPVADHSAAICAFYDADLMWVITGHPNVRTFVKLIKKRMADRKLIAKPIKKKKAIKRRMAKVYPLRAKR